MNERAVKFCSTAALFVITISLMVLAIVVARADEARPGVLIIRNRLPVDAYVWLGGEQENYENATIVPARSRVRVPYDRVGPLLIDSSAWDASRVYERNGLQPKRFHLTLTEPKATSR